ncbi:MAG: hypothetical protein AAF492_25430, partial [Verrucomicrobiota bacterium]
MSKNGIDKSRPGDNFLFLLVALMLLFVLYPVLYEQAVLGRYLIDIFMFIILFGGIRSVVHDRKILLHALLLAAASAFIRLSHIVANAKLTGILSLIIHIFFLIYFVFVLLRYILSEEGTTSNNIYGAICVYLILGLIW